MGRPWLLSELAKELLGPRKGPHEHFPDDPLQEYLVGALVPANTEAEPVDEEPDGHELKPEEGEDADEGRPISHQHKPALDPTRRPSSMGISFVHSGQDPSNAAFDIAVEYARYAKVGKDGDPPYKRHPRAIVLRGSDLTRALEKVARSHRATVYLKPKNPKAADVLLERVSKEESAEARIDLISRPSPNGPGTVVTVFLSNALPAPTEWKDTPECTLFQSSLRIRLDETVQHLGMSNDALDENHGEVNEESIDESLYVGRDQKARGHLTSATWREHDPQIKAESDRSTLSVQLDDPDVDPTPFGDAPPFAWVDSSHPGLESEGIPSRWDLRTDHLPMINLPAPEMNPESGIAAWKTPSPHPSDLAHAVSGPALVALLQPIVDGYDEWINSRFTGATPIDRELRSRARHTLDAMRSGLNLLDADENCREAFRLANRAIGMTQTWKGDREFPWRRFQLAFALQTLESVANPDSAARNDVDLLWVPTGGGKTEAYLLVLAFRLALRRLEGGEASWFGVDAMTRYTLRLLTLQQFRRTLSVITALEHLRNHPDIQLRRQGAFSRQPFGIGIWVGGGYTPNRLEGGKINADDLDRTVRHWRSKVREANQPRNPPLDVGGMGALHHLVAGHVLDEHSQEQAPEPAQVLDCPACRAPLSLPSLKSDDGAATNWNAGDRLHLVVHSPLLPADLSRRLAGANGVLSATALHHHSDVHTVSLELSGERSERAVEEVWVALVASVGRGQLQCASARPSRPGYFLLSRRGGRGGREKHAYDFMVACPNPECALARPWSGHLPAGRAHIERAGDPYVQGTGIQVPSALRARPDVATSCRMTPIPAYTVDDQVYAQCPSVIIATVDKFARMPYSASTGNLFGHVDGHDPVQGFHRAGADEDVADGRPPYWMGVDLHPLPSPDLVIQDELHLVEGPLGSLVGFYESVVDALMSEGLGQEGRRAKYIASTATIRAASDQTQCLFDRTLRLFPPKGPTWADRGLILEREGAPPHVDTPDEPGRLYLGIAPVGVSAQVLQRNVYARLIHSAARLAAGAATPRAADRFWTLAGYFNALRELAGAEAVMGDDVKERLELLEPGGRGAGGLVVRDLSGRMRSGELPVLLDQLEKRKCGDAGAIDVLLATSMFGTGVDVDRLNMMMVTGQPKSTAQYIQATGRVGRDSAALVTSYLRTSRPRDLDHFERFLGYHLRLALSVEPVTVRPFADPVVQRAGGPLMAAWMRLSRRVRGAWRTKTAAVNFTGTVDPDAPGARSVLTDRNLRQPPLRRMGRPPNGLDIMLRRSQDAWLRTIPLARAHRAAAVAAAAAAGETPPRGPELPWSHTNPYRDPPPYVVFGSPVNVKHPGLFHAVYSEHHPTPQSLRTVDATTAFENRR